MAQPSASLQSENYNSVCRNVYAHRDIVMYLTICRVISSAIFRFLFQIHSLFGWNRLLRGRGCEEY